MGKAANLDLVTKRAVTDLHQYKNIDLKFQPLYSEIAPIKVVIPNGFKETLLLASSWLLREAKIHSL